MKNKLLKYILVGVLACVARTSGTLFVHDAENGPAGRAVFALDLLCDETSVAGEDDPVSDSGTDPGIQTELGKTFRRYTIQHQWLNDEQTLTFQ